MLCCACKELESLVSLVLVTIVADSSQQDSFTPLAQTGISKRTLAHTVTYIHTYTNSQSYISLLESQSEQTTAILRDLIVDCRKLASQFRPPTHLFSHKKGTYLDEVLDAVDSCANDTALIQEASMLEDPQLPMQSSLSDPGCPVSVGICVARKLRPCPSYSRRRDRINLGLWRSLYKGGGGT